MTIERLQIEEGFLNDLDLTFGSGLNVLIGPRGAGKTSVIELIRFCLDIPSLTERAATMSRQHALSILGSGRVTVTLRHGSGKLVVTRTAQGRSPKTAAKFDEPIILSQNEIESVGLEPVGRLKIIDGFRSTKTNSGELEERLLSKAASLTVEMQQLSLEIESIRLEIDARTQVSDELVEAEKQQKILLQSLDKTKKEQEKLDSLSKRLSAVSVRTNVFDRTLTAVRAWRQKLIDLQPVRIEKWPDAAMSEDQLIEERKHLATALTLIQQAIVTLNKVETSIAHSGSLNQEDRATLDEEARELRRQLDQIKEGAGAASRRVGQLREKAGELSAYKGLINEKMELLGSLQVQRGALLEDLELFREERYGERLTIVDNLNEELGPRIDIKVDRAGLHTEYTSAISAALRGSRLHYNTLAPILSKQLSPRELVEAVEGGDAASLAEVAEISIDRAKSLVAHFRSQGLEGIVTCPIEDSVQMSLLDGNEYKDTDELSTGQRCTVILPILLNRHGSSLIVDQPEDHLDNAFIVETLINAIIKSKQHSQLIFSTHNANIPVLGEAERVILLGSDGKRGFVRHAGALEDSASVEAITNVMEGGKEAFQRRAVFYKKALGIRSG